MKMKGKELGFVTALACGLFGINAAQATVLTLDFERAGTDVISPPRP